MCFTETPSLDDLPTFTKTEVAAHQLERALHLFLDESDYVCAITLAGASEEILGKLLERSGKEHSLGSLVELCVAIEKNAPGEECSPKVFVTIANEFRDGLKHYTDGQPITVSREAAVEILDRALANYWQLTAQETPRMRRFREEVHGC
jgi:hypothetical protein